MFGFSEALRASTPISVIPQPTVVVVNDGEFLLTASTPIIAPAAKNEASLLAESLRPATGFSLNVTDKGDAKAAIQLQLVPISHLEPEGSYTLDVTADGVKITSPSQEGLFYGTQTLRQLLPPAVFSPTAITGVQWAIPCVHIEDQPRFAWRGMMLDTARYYFPVSFVKQFIDLMAIHKLNRFHWHLTDDQGWRIEIKKYPKLTEVGSKRPGSMVFDPDNPTTTKYDGIPRSGFYTQDEIRDVVAYAAARHVVVVPEIEMPGHSAAAIAAYPELGVSGQPIQVRIAWGVEKHILNPSPATIAFYQDVLTEVMALFPSEWIHLGGDEAPKDEWNKDPVIQAQIKSLGLPNADALQAWYMGQMDQFLTTHGRHLIGWDEILQGGLSPGAIVMSWRGTKGATQAASQGHQTVNSANRETYFNYYQSKEKGRKPNPTLAFLPLERAYAFDPVPAGLPSEQQKFVLGGQGQVWTPYISNIPYLENMTFPRECALAEDVWTSPQNKNYQQFLDRLKVHVERLKAMGINFRPLDGPTTKPSPN